MNKEKLTFEAKGHNYYLDGVKMTGCTTVLGVIAKPRLIQWSADMAIEYLKNNVKFPITILDWETKLEEARKAHLRKKEEAGQKGTDIHAMIEDIITMAIEMNEGVISLDVKSENKQVQNFLNWADKKNVRFLESEKKVYSKKHFVAGTADFVCEINGRKYIGDIKTTSGIYDRTPMAQTAGYRMMLEEMGEKDFVGSIIINIKKDGSFDEEKDVYWSEDYQEDLRLFMGALEVYRVLNNTIIK